MPNKTRTPSFKSDINELMETLIQCSLNESFEANIKGIVSCMMKGAYKRGQQDAMDKAIQINKHDDKQ